MLTKDFLAMVPDMATPALTPDCPASVASDLDDAAWHDHYCPVDEQPWAFNKTEYTVCIGQELGYYHIDPNSFDEMTTNLHQSIEDLDECLKNIATAQKTVQEVLHESTTVEQPEILHAVCQGVAAPAKAKLSPETACKIISEAFPDIEDKDVELSDIDSNKESVQTVLSPATECSSGFRDLAKSLLSKNPWEVTVVFEDTRGKDHKIPMLLDTGSKCNLIPEHYIDSLGLKANIQPAHNALIVSLSDNEVEYIGTVELQWSWPNAAVRKPVTTKFFVVTNNNYAITMPILGGLDIEFNDILVFNVRVFGSSLYEPAYRYTTNTRERKQLPETTSNRASHQRTTTDFDSLTKAYQAAKKKDFVFPQSRK